MPRSRVIAVRIDPEEDSILRRLIDAADERVAADGLQASAGSVIRTLIRQAGEGLDGPATRSAPNVLLSSRKLKDRK